MISTLVPGEIHLHVVEWEKGKPLPFDILSSEERERANRFKNSEALHSFVFGRSALRLKLADCLRCEPQEIGFNYQLSGKPTINHPRWAGMDFNLTHSGNLIVIALGRVERIGVDIEKLQNYPDPESIAIAILSKSELEHFRLLSVSARNEFLLQIWTQKEALLKASGFGLSIDPRGIEISWKETDTITLKTLPRELTCSASNQWVLEPLLTRAPYVASVAALLPSSVIPKIRIISGATPFSVRSGESPVEHESAP